MQPWEILKPALEAAFAACRQVAGEVLELEVALSGQRVGVEELGKAVDLAGSKATSTNGKRLKTSSFYSWRPAAAHAHHPIGVFAL